MGIALLSSVALLSACEPKQQANAETGAVASSASVKDLQVTDVKVGTGDVAKSGDKVKVQYTGTLTNGEKFDSSYDHGEPFSFQLGAGQVIQGWDEGVVGMKVGGKRILLVPPEKAYGEAGYPPVIPKRATLKFEIELLGVE